MHNIQNEWLTTIRGEYLHDFIKLGGAAVKFVVPGEDAACGHLLTGLQKTSEEENYLFMSLSASKIRIHMIDKLFHEAARQLDWDDLAYGFVRKIIQENGCQPPVLREDFNVRQIAALNGREENSLRNKIHSWIEKKIYYDFKMCQEFRIAMIRLCEDQLDAPFLSHAVKEWLRGELQKISTLKKERIFQKIARHNARHMLFSLVHWLRVNGKSGLVLALDISRYLVSTRSKNPDDGFFYSVAATLDAYEVLRQFIDQTDEMEGCLIVVLAPSDFLSDDKRGVNRYDALKLRIWNEVRDRRRQNPLASLVRLTDD
jgi:hypothetical protein